MLFSKKISLSLGLLIASIHFSYANEMHPVSEGEAGRILNQMQGKCKQNHAQIEQKLAEWNAGSIRGAISEGTSKRDALKEKLFGSKKKEVDAAISKFYQDVTLKEQEATKAIIAYEKIPKEAPPKGGVKIMPDAPTITPDSQAGRAAQDKAIRDANTYGSFCDAETAKILSMMK
jgi:hypothetical protein